MSAMDRIFGPPPGRNDAWVDGYEWALSHLTDPGVLADARRLALAHESAEAAREAPGSTVEPHGTYHGVAAPPVASSPQSVSAMVLAEIDTLADMAAHHVISEVGLARLDGLRRGLAASAGTIS